MQNSIEDKIILILTPCIDLSYDNKPLHLFEKNKETQNIREISECSPMVWETEVQSQVESYQRLKKLYLMLPSLTLSSIR